MLQKKLMKRLTVYCFVLFLVTGSVIPVLPRLTVAEEDPIKAISESESIKLDPSYQHKPFDGWGTALVWFANVTGGWPDDIRNKLADDLFGEDGLNFNIARYNIGGGDAPETEPYMRIGGAVPGYWNRPEEYGPPEDNKDNWTEQEDWWDPENPDHWNWDADANQRWWLKAAKARGADTFEAFSNSPPYFMTRSGYVSGNWNPSEDNIKPDQFENFATYLTTVVDHLQQDMGIEFKTLSPVNEPNTNYWGAKGRQEGSHWDPASQAKIINKVKKQLDAKGLHTVVSAMDETNPQKFRENWEQYNSTTRNNIRQLNVHTYWPGQRTGARDIAKGTGTRLWMSEVDLSPGGIGQNHEDIRTGLALSERITSDVQKLEPEAWVLWQAIEDEVNMNPEHENGNWGLIQVEFDPDDFGNVKIYKNKKYYAMGNYSKFIRPGYQVINANSENTLAAINKEDKSIVMVYTNSSSEAKEINFDLSGFDIIKEGAKATPYVTSATENLEKKTNIGIANQKLSTVVQPQSITTFVVSGVSGVNEEKVTINPDKKYKLINKNSDKVLDTEKNEKSVVQNTNNHNKKSQNWSIQKLTDGYSANEIYKIVNTKTEKVLSVENGSVELQTFANTANQKWKLSSSGNGEYTFLNMQNGDLLDVVGESIEEGAEVGVWKPTTGNNQVWEIVEARVETSAAKMLKLVERLEEEDAFSDENVIHQLKLQLTTVDIFEKKGLNKKVVKHVKGLNVLLEYQKENELISEKAYQTLKANAEYLIEKYQ
ncbi:glycoside hydrolase [Virgibacillus dakarensis]|uniref:glycoside hydrolase n=1 Tax=Virgibacillus dakarensis TaxID=1917889 RepID=UPI00135662A2|nr:glycoside hydrolase [Virgibacillus dakarensis]